MSTGLEHDALGRRTEDVDVRTEQVKKRQRKIQTAREREDFSPGEFGDPDADTLVVSWGSNEGAILEAMEILEEQDVQIRFLSVPYISPRPDLTADIAAAETTIVLEANATGQFADLLEHDTLTRVHRINKFTGVQFDAEEVASRIQGVLAEGEEVTA